MAGRGKRSVIDGVRSAVEQSPDNESLRLHLATLLNDEGEFQDALEQATIVLEETPDRVDALAEACRAAEGLGDDRRAAAYRRLHDAVAAEPAPKHPDDGGPEEPVKLHAVRGGAIEGEVTEIERPAMTLDDVGGMESIKRRLRTAFLAPLENPALRRMYGKSLRGGLLLYGPPGCGKTFIARATGRPARSPLHRCRAPRRARHVPGAERAQPPRAL